MNVCRDLILSCHEKTLCCLKCGITQSVVQSEPARCSRRAVQIAGCRGGSPRWLAIVLVARTSLVESRSRRACTPPIVYPSTSTFQGGLITQTRASRREHQTCSQTQTKIWKYRRTIAVTETLLRCDVLCCAGPGVTRRGVSQHAVARRQSADASVWVSASQAR